MIGKSDAEAILTLFNVYDLPRAIHCLEESGQGDNYRGIFRIETFSSDLVCRICGEKVCPKWLIEQRVRFSNLLYQNGVPVAKNLGSNSSSCINIQLEESKCKYNVSLEKYLGSDLIHADLSTFRTFGKLIGQMHRISQAHSAKIGISYVASALKSNKASFARIMEKSNPTFTNESLVNRLAFMHDELITELIKKWETLPAGAVHGDLGIYNNLTQTENGLGIIDFNRAGDEVFLGDALSTFYASIHKLSWQERLASIPQNQALYAFFSGYNSERKLNKIETKIYPLIAALFDGLFYCKNAIELWNIGAQSEALERMQMGESHFDSILHPYPIPELKRCNYDNSTN